MPKFWPFLSSQEFLQDVDCRPWNSLSKRRVQPYGYDEFQGLFGFFSLSVAPKLVEIQPFSNFHQVNNYFL